MRRPYAPLALALALPYAGAAGDEGVRHEGLRLRGTFEPVAGRRFADALVRMAHDTMGQRDRDVIRAAEQGARSVSPPRFLRGGQQPAWFAAGRRLRLVTIAGADRLVHDRFGEDAADTIAAFLSH